jgi:hypothetical protein
MTIWKTNIKTIETSSNHVDVDLKMQMKLDQQVSNDIRKVLKIIIRCICISFD